MSRRDLFTEKLFQPGMDQVHFSMCRILLFFRMVLLLALESHAHENPGCAATVPELRALLGNPAFPLQWQEITMDDGKPLRVSIQEKKGLLLLDFSKAREGLWAESTGAICKTGAGLEISFTREQVRVGPAAGWLMRLSLVNGGQFTLTKIGTEKLRITTHGWNGIFVPVQ